MWTRFMDMHSGGQQKEKWAYILIEASQDKAEELFYRIFGHDPNNVTCECCGSDYSIGDNESLEEITAYDRGCKYVHSKGYVEEWDGYNYRPYLPIQDYVNEPDVLVIFASEIELAERKYAESKKKIAGHCGLLEYFEKS